MSGPHSLARPDADGSGNLLRSGSPIAHPEAPRAVRFDPNAHEFEAFKVTPGCDKRTGKDTPLGGRTYSKGKLAGSTLDEALADAEAKMFLDHKETLIIRERGFDSVRWANGVESRPVDRLHIFTIKKKSSPRYTWNKHTLSHERSHDLYPVPVCTVDAQELFGLTAESLFSADAPQTEEAEPERARLRRVGR